MFVFRCSYFQSSFLLDTLLPLRSAYSVLVLSSFCSVVTHQHPGTIPNSLSTLFLVILPSLKQGTAYFTSFSDKTLHYQAFSASHFFYIFLTYRPSFLDFILILIPMYTNSVISVVLHFSDSFAGSPVAIANMLDAPQTAKPHLTWLLLTFTLYLLLLTSFILPQTLLGQRFCNLLWNFLFLSLSGILKQD